MKFIVKRKYHYMSDDEISEYEQKLKSESVDEKNFIAEKPVLNENDEIIIVDESLDRLKNELKAEIIRRGYNSITDFAEKNHGKYKTSTIKMNLAKNNRHSETVLAYVAKKLGFNLKKEIIYELEK